ncbi:MAG: hypothetical protein V1944_01510 [Candidatus Aenigmatarchaeota archaeon]
MEVTREYLASRHLLNSFRRHLDKDALSKYKQKDYSPIVFKDGLIALGIDCDKFVTPKREKDLADNWLDCLHEENPRVRPEDLTRHFENITPQNLDSKITRFLRELKETGTTYEHHIKASSNAVLRTSLVKGTREFFQWAVKLLKLPFLISLSPVETLQMAADMKLGFSTDLVAGSSYFREYGGRHVFTCELEDMCYGEKKSRVFESMMKDYGCFAHINVRGTDDKIVDGKWIGSAVFGLVIIAEEDPSRLALFESGKYECEAPVYIVVPEAREDLRALEGPIVAYELAFFKASVKRPDAILEMIRSSREVMSAFTACLSSNEEEFPSRKDFAYDSFYRFLSLYRIPLGSEEISFFPIFKGGILEEVGKLKSSTSISEGKEAAENSLKIFQDSNFELHIKKSDEVEIEELADLLVKNPELRWDSS